MSDQEQKVLTLCIIHDNEDVLLGMKKRGFGAGKWNGFGGKVEAGETLEQAAKREVLEESGVTIHDLTELGVLDFFYTDGLALEVHIFKTTQYEGEPVETEEMRPEWFHVSNIPYTHMWPDDMHWFPYFLDDKRFVGEFHFDGNGNIVKHVLSENR